MILTIAIPTVVGREDNFEELYNYLMLQKTDEVEIIYIKDDKEMSIGAKRQKLYEMAKGEWTVMIDDDDSVSDDYIEQVLAALEHNPDCVGYQEDINLDGIKHKSFISKQYDRWLTFKNVHYRSPFFKTPIRTILCLKVGVPDMRFGEDQEFSKRIYPLLKTEVYLDIPMYYYNRFTKKDESYEQRYGLDRK